MHDDVEHTEVEMVDHVEQPDVLEQLVEADDEVHDLVLVHLELELVEWL